MLNILKNVLFCYVNYQKKKTFRGKTANLHDTIKHAYSWDSVLACYTQPWDVTVLKMCVYKKYPVSQEFDTIMKYYLELHYCPRLQVCTVFILFYRNVQPHLFIFLLQDRIWQTPLFHNGVFFWVKTLTYIRYRRKNTWRNSSRTFWK